MIAERAETGCGPPNGAGIQVGFGYPFTNRDLRRFGGIDAGLVASRADLRVRLGRFIEATFSPRLMMTDEATSYQTDFRGQPDVIQSRKMVSLLLPAGHVLVW